MNEIPEAVILREARRVLRLLSGGAAHLAAKPNGRFAFITGGENRWSSVKPEFVAEFRKRGWLKACDAGPGSFAISDAGEGWIARALNPNAPFAAQHGDLVPRVITDTDGTAQLVTVNEAESPIARLRARGLLTKMQFAAGEKLRRDFTLARMMPRLCADLEAPVVSGRRGAAGAENFSDTVIAARQRFNRAVKAVGPGLSDILVNVCCHLAGLESAEAEKNWPRHSARVVLALALDRLAAHYGMGIAPKRARLRSWRSEMAENESAQPA